eukprot:3663931-Rhodomonas_salina.1
MDRLDMDRLDMDRLDMDRLTLSLRVGTKGDAREGAAEIGEGSWAARSHILYVSTGLRVGRRSAIQHPSTGLPVGRRSPICRT